MTYCSGSEKATINITSPIKEKIILKNPQISIEVSSTNTGTFEDYTHSMDQPINKAFDKPVSSVILNDLNNDWIFSSQYPASNPIVHRPCPIPSIVDGKLLLDFDPGAYDDNSGTCTYRVFFSGWQLTATNQLGQSIIRKYEMQPTFIVSCGDECPEGFCKCFISEYPGYCCNNCSSSADEIRALVNDVRLKNGR